MVHRMSQHGQPVRWPAPHSLAYEGVCKPHHGPGMIPPPYRNYADPRLPFFRNRRPWGPPDRLPHHIYGPESGATCGRGIPSNFGRGRRGYGPMPFNSLFHHPKSPWIPDQHLNRINKSGIRPIFRGRGLPPGIPGAGRFPMPMRGMPPPRGLMSGATTRGLTTRGRGRMGRDSIKRKPINQANAGDKAMSAEDKQKMKVR